MGVTRALILALVLGSLPSVSGAETSESTPLAAPRVYARRTTSLDADAEAVLGSAVAYGAGNAWVATLGGEVRRYDTAGRVSTYRPSAEGVNPGGIWASGSGAIARIGRTLVAISESGALTEVGKVEAGLRGAVPVKDGYVAMGAGSTSLVHVSWSGERRVVSLTAQDRPPDGDAQDDQTAADEPPAGSDEDGEGGDALRPAGGGVLARLDADTVVYVTPSPYAAWVVRLDGSVRALPVDDRGAPPPEASAAATDSARRLIRVEPAGAGIRRADWFEGRLAVERRYAVIYQPVDAAGAASEGATSVATLSLIDLIDVDSGRVVERIDVSAWKDRGIWAGVSGSDLVFLGLGFGGRRAPYIAFAAAR